jgi:hypothetical protein
MPRMGDKQALPFTNPKLSPEFFQGSWHMNLNAALITMWILYK